MGFMGSLYYYEDRSVFYRALTEHFRSRGVPESKFGMLTERWVKRKGYRLPQVQP